uniref:TonB-dependent receptor n=1 Tax=Sphingomonas sp. JE1 TaxID=1628059 RepID=A0A0D5A000_9SPHN|nr:MULTISPECIES: TonB-dependent receptor [unclassified Sphingomonas]AJW29516.1 TonB-dependent receptor [Sphingomonas sp. JE1]
MALSKKVYASLACASVIACTWMMTCEAAFAQTSGAAVSPDANPDIIVTANKREESINRVGLTIKAIGAEDLNRRQIRDLQDVAQAVPSLSFSQTEQSTPVYTLRGIGFYDTSLASYPTVSVYVDQAPLPFPTLTALTAFDLERIEVLKGPQGILFGNNATGGAINYIAAKPTSEFSAGGSLSYGRFSTVAANGFASGPLSSNLLARASFNLTKGSGYQISATRSKDRNGAPDTLAGRVLLTWTPTERLKVDINLNGWRDRTEPMAGQYVVFMPTFAPTPVNGPFIPNATSSNRVADWSQDFPPSADNRLYQAVARADYDLTDEIALTSLTSYIDYKHDQVPEGDGLPQHRIDFDYNRGYVKSFSQEVRIADNVNPVFRWLIGANYSHDRVYEDNFVDFRDATTGNNPAFIGWKGNGFYARQRMSNYAVFANGEYSLGSITLKAGARYTEARRRTYNCVYSPYDPALSGLNDPEPVFFTDLSNLLTGANQPVPGPRECYNILPDTLLLGPYIKSLNQNNLSWRFGIDWRVTDQTLLYFNLAKGYKAGGFPTLSGTGTAFAPVTQESVLSYEGGIKTQSFDRRLSINLAGFYFDYTNKQLRSKTVDPIFGAIDALVNIPKSSIKGIELEVQARPLAGLTLGGALTYLDATIDRFTGVAVNGVSATFDGSPIPYTPKWQIGSSVNYTIPISETAKLFVGGQLTHRSATNSVIGSPKQYTIPSYTLVDLQAGVELEDGRYTIMAWGKNVTDEFYLTNVVSSVNDGIGRYTGRPATYGVTISFHY